MPVGCFGSMQTSRLSNNDFSNLQGRGKMGQEIRKFRKLRTGLGNWGWGGGGRGG